MHCPVKASVIRPAVFFFFPFAFLLQLPPLAFFFIFPSLNESLSPSPRPDLFGGNTFSLIFLSLSQRYCVQCDINSLTLMYFYLAGSSMKTLGMKNTGCCCVAEKAFVSDKVVTHI